MDVERWTEIKVIDCPKLGDRVATGIAVKQLRAPHADPELIAVSCTLAHCIGAAECGLALPAEIKDMVRFGCPVGKLLEEAPSGRTPRLSAASSREAATNQIPDSRCRLTGS